MSNELTKVADDRDSLFILHYGGHASTKKGTTVRECKKDNLPDSPDMEWSLAMRALFRTLVICDKLFIFGCCHVGDMIDPTLEWETSCELLGACTADVEESALKVSSFTAALLEELTENTYDFWELHSALCSTDKRKKYNLANPPHYHKLAGLRTELASTLMRKVGSPEENENRPQRASDILARLTAISDAVICVTITFRCTADALVEEFKEVKRDWRPRFRFAATDPDDDLIKACHGRKLLAAFDGESCLTIWTFPVWLWNAMAPVSDHKHIGTVGPQSFALATGGGQNEQHLVTNSSSSMTVGEASASRQPKNLKKIGSILSMTLKGTTAEDNPHVGPKRPLHELPQQSRTSRPINRGGEGTRTEECLGMLLCGTGVKNLRPKYLARRIWQIL